MNKEELEILENWASMQSCGNNDCHVCKSFKLTFAGLMIKLKGGVKNG